MNNNSVNNSIKPSTVYRLYLKWARSLPNAQMQHKHKQNIILYRNLYKLQAGQNYTQFMKQQQHVTMQQLYDTAITLHKLNNISDINIINMLLRRIEAIK